MRLRVDYGAIIERAADKGTAADFAILKGTAFKTAINKFMVL